MIGDREFLQRFCPPCTSRDTRIAGRIRLSVEARLRGHHVEHIANWLEVSASTARDYLSYVGYPFSRSSWRRGGYQCCAARLEALGMSPAFLQRTGAVLHGDYWFSLDTPLEPTPQWKARAARVRRRLERRRGVQ